MTKALWRWTIAGDSQLSNGSQHFRSGAWYNESMKYTNAIYLRRISTLCDAACYDYPERQEHDC